MIPAATQIVVDASLPPVTLPMAVGAAEALAVAAQVDLVALGAPMGEEARFLRNGTISIGSCLHLIRWLFQSFRIRPNSCNGGMGCLKLSPHVLSTRQPH